MRFDYKSLLFTLVVVHNPAYGANKVGNGGDGVFCKGAPGQLLDFYEGDIPLKVDGVDPIRIAEKQLNNLRSIAPKVAEQYIRRLKEMQNEIAYLNEVSLTDIQDSDHLFKPLAEDCQVLQVVIRRSNPLSSEKRFLIRKDLWARLSPLHQAGVLTHEVIYEHLTKLGEENSIKARKLNRFLYENADLKNFWFLVQELELPLYPSLQ